MSSNETNFKQGKKVRIKNQFYYNANATVININM